MCRTNMSGANDLVGTQLFLSLAENDAAGRADAAVVALSSLEVGADSNRINRISQRIEDIVPLLHGGENEASVVCRT